MYPSILINCLSIVPNPPPNDKDWPPLHSHRVVAVGAVAFLGKKTKVHVGAGIKKKNERTLLLDLNAFLPNSLTPTTPVVTLYGRSYTVPLLLQRSLAHNVPLSAVAGIVRNPRNTNWVDLLDLLTNYGEARNPKTEDIFGELLHLPGPHKPDTEKLFKQGVKKIRSAHLLFLAKLSLLWVKQCVVTGDVGDPRKDLIELKKLFLNLELKKKGKEAIKAVFEDSL